MRKWERRRGSDKEGGRTHEVERLHFAGSFGSFGGVFESFFSIFSGERVSKKSKEISMPYAVNDFLLHLMWLGTSTIFCSDTWICSEEYKYEHKLDRV